MYSSAVVTIAESRTAGVQRRDAEGRPFPFLPRQIVAGDEIEGGVHEVQRTFMIAHRIERIGEAALELAPVGHRLR